MEVTLELVRPIPSVALVPVALVALGFGYRLEIAIVAFACTWPVLLLDARRRSRGVEPRLIEVARALRLSFAARVAKIIVPAALPRIFVAFRLAAGFALIVAVTVEIAVNPLGLGAGIMTAGQALRPELMLAYLLWIGIVGFALNAALVLAQQRLFGRAALVGGGAMKSASLARSRASSSPPASSRAVADRRRFQAGLAGLPARPRSRLGGAGAWLRREQSRPPSSPARSSICWRAG